MPAADPSRYALQVVRSAARALAQTLPEAVAAAVVNFIRGDLLDRPHAVGKPLSRELAGRWSARRGEYRVIYRIDDTNRVVTVLVVEHRRSAYRRR